MSAATIFLAVALLLTAVPTVGAEAATAPSVRLQAASQRVTLHRFGTRVPLDLGVYVAPVGGDFELKVRSATWGAAPSAVQIDPTTRRAVRDIPADMLRGFEGLRNFLRVTVTDRRGNEVANKKVTFCPNGWDRQRLNDSGPQSSRFPEFCGNGFPFMRGSVWGIDNGWATSPLSASWWDDGGVPSVRLPDGRYTVEVRILKPWADLLGVRGADRAVTLNAVVVEGREHNFGDMFGSMSAEEPTMRPLQNVPTVRNPDPSTLPDLVALPAWNIQVERRRQRDLLGFSTTPWNKGPAPLLVEGFRRPGEDVMDAYQYFTDAQGRVVGRAAAGKMAYHAARDHDHWHFLQFAAFDLLDASQQQVVRSRKQGFCLAPTDAVDLTVPRATMSPWEIGIGTQCGGPNALWVREVLQAGWGDTYHQGIAGQAFDITDLPNGTYYLRVTVNPKGKIKQVTTANDTALRRVKLGGRAGARTVWVAPWKGIDA